MPKFLFTLLDNVLDVSRITRGKLQMQTEIFDLGPVTQHANESVSDMAENHHVRINLQLAAQQVWVNGDPARLLQAEVNLLTNAIKYSPANSSVQVQLSAEDQLAKFTA